MRSFSPSGDEHSSFASHSELVEKLEKRNQTGEFPYTTTKGVEYFDGVSFLSGSFAVFLMYMHAHDVSTHSHLLTHLYLIVIDAFIFRRDNYTITQLHTHARAASPQTDLSLDCQQRTGVEVNTSDQ